MPLQRLSYVGAMGMGALIYRPEMDHISNKEIQLELDSIAKAAYKNHVKMEKENDMFWKNYKP